MGDTTSLRGDQDIREQRSTYAFFMGLAKWGSLVTAALVLLLTVWFCTTAGFWPALAAAIVVLVAGTLLLKGAH